MASHKHLSDYKKLSWVSKPKPGHLVHFYQNESDLLAPLTEYIGSGLASGDVCIVIATAGHLKKLQARLIKNGLDVESYQENGAYITLDAANTLQKFMVDGLPDRQRFFEVIGALLKDVFQSGRPIRAYGEMVALLWQRNNKEAVVKLEGLWNEIAETYAFALFCAYPELHFIMHHNVIEEIRDYHDVNVQLGLPNKIFA